MTTTFDFPVKLSPIKTNGVVIPHKVSVFRTDLNKPIGVVSDKYSLIPHNEVIKGMRQALGTTKYEEKVELLKDGAHMFATYKIPGVQVEVAKGDMVALQVIARNSYDGRKAFSLTLGAFRLVCTNGMIIGREFFTFSQRHVEAGTEFNSELLKERIGEMVSSFKGSLEDMKKMTYTQLSKNPDTLFDPEIVDLPEYLVKAAKEEYLKAKVHTVWGFYNSLTFAISHSMRKENPKTQIKFLQRSWAMVAEL